MSRDRREINRSLFRRVSDRLAAFDENYQLSEVMRYVSLSGEDRERSLVANAEILCRFYGVSIKALVVREGNDASIMYLIAGPRFALDSIKACRQATSGESLLFWNYFKPVFQRSPIEIHDIFSVEPSEEYEGHQSADVFSCLQPIYVFEIKEDPICLTKSLNEILTSGIRLDEDISQDYAESINNIEYANCANEISVLKSIVNYGTSRQYLDIYRIIENIFFKVTCKKLHEEAGVKLPEAVFYEKIESIIGWRPKEIDSLTQVVEAFSVRNQAVFCEELRRIAPEIASIDCSGEGLISAIKAFSARIYRFRNECVHWRTNENPDIESYVEAYSLSALKMVSAVSAQFFSKDNVCSCQYIRPL